MFLWEFLEQLVRKVRMTDSKWNMQTTKNLAFSCISRRDFTKQLYWNHTSAWVFSCKFAAYFKNTFS